MRGHEVARSLIGSTVVYLVIGACGGGGSSKTASSGDDAGGLVDALSDALANPVPDALADSSGSGSRLKLQYYVGTDGSKVPAGVLDSMLATTCVYNTAADGTTRCLPPGSDASAAYADSACTTPLATVPKGCAATKYALRTIPTKGTCETAQPIHVYGLGAAFTPGMDVYESGGSGGGCVAISSMALTTIYDLYSVGAELPPSTFVQATRQTE
jgi:hypothetical protein